LRGSGELAISFLSNVRGLRGKGARKGLRYLTYKVGEGEKSAELKRFGSKDKFQKGEVPSGRGGQNYDLYVEKTK